MTDTAAAPSADTPVAEPSARVEWVYDVPLLTSRFMLWDFTRVILISVAAMYVIVALTGLIAEGELIILPLEVFVITASVMFGLFVLTALLLGNRHRARFTVDERGVEYRAEKRERALNRAVVLIGLLAARPGTAGAGVLATGREHELIPWESVHRVTYHPGPRVIALRNTWRTVMRLHCTAEQYEQIAETVRAYHAAHPAPTRA